MAGLEGGSKRGKARGGGAIPRVTESGGMRRRQPASRACRALLPFQPASPLPKMLSWKRQGELRPFLPLTLPLTGGSGHVSRAFGVEAQLAPAPQSPGSAFRAAPWVPALGRWRETWCCGPRTSAKGCRGWGLYKNEERIPGQRKRAVSCNPIPLRSRTPGQQYAWAWDSVPAGRSGIMPGLPRPPPHCEPRATEVGHGVAVGGRCTHSALSPPHLRTWVIAANL